MADEDEVKTEKEKPKKSGSKKLLIIGLFVGLLLGGGGAVGAVMMLGGSSEEETHEEEVVVVEEPKEELFYVKVERMTLPIVHKNRILGNATIDFSMKVASKEKKIAVISYLPEIRDAMLRHFSHISIGKSGNPRNIDYARLKETLKDISNEVLHDPLVMEVMIVQARQF